MTENSFNTIIQFLFVTKLDHYFWVSIDAKTINSSQEPITRPSLHFIFAGHAKCVKLLLEYGADPTARMVGGWTPAHCAAETGRLNVLKVLIDQQSPVMIPDNSGDTPKRVAEIYGHTACVELLER